MQIADDKVVKFHYKLTNDEGKVLDSSEGRDPLPYLHGKGAIVPGLEAAMAGKTVGDAFHVDIEPAQGYGEQNPQMIQGVPREQFEGVDNLQPGMQFQAQTPAGPQVVTVTEVGESQVTVDANHPLAGQTLHFDIEIAEVRDATQEEIDHGHAQ